MKKEWKLYTPEEKVAILLEGYRRLRTFMMLDADIVAVSPASVWRVLSRAGLLRKWNRRPPKKETGFEQPRQPHQHWHNDIRLNSAIGYITPGDMLGGHQQEVFAEGIGSWRRRGNSGNRRQRAA